MSHPVVVEARLESPLSRWLWLVKWVLLIPHAVVLFFLWIAFAVLTVIAWFAIVFSGRYPRGIFDFNVGVMRWTWRVVVYGYSALSTDRYPPFTLHDVPDYPARLAIAYPERLSRGLVWVKSWLLAIPHYVVVGFFVGGGVGWASRHDNPAWGGGLVGVLVLIAAVVLLFTGRYPRTIFDLVLGMSRWALRVGAYAALMTDVYPPFRLDQGGSEPPDDAVAAEPVAPGPTTHRRWGAGRIVAVTIGSLIAAASLVGVVAGIGLVGVNVGLRHSDGFLVAPAQTVTTSSYAVTTRDVDLGWGVLPEKLIGDVRIEATSDVPVFVGIAPTADVDGYLDGVGHAVVTGMHRDDMRHMMATYDERPGGPPAMAPTMSRMWRAHASGRDATLTWSPEKGNWTAVVMNADGSANVDADVTAAATLPVLRWGAAAALISSGIGLAVGLAIVIVAVTTGRRD